MIEQMTHVAILGKSVERADLLGWLYGERGFHAMPIAEEDASWTGSFARLPDETQGLDAKSTRINSVLTFCQEYSSSKPGFLDAMLPLKVVGTKAEVASAVEEVSIDLLYDKTGAMRSAIEASNEKLSRLKSLKASIEQFAFLGDNLPKITALKNIAFEVVAVMGQGGRAFLMDERIVDGQVAAEELFADQTHSYFALAAAASESGVLRALIDDHGLHAHPIPKVRHGAQQELLLVNNDILEASALLTKQRSEANRFADAWIRKAGLASGYWESERTLAAARLGMAESSHLFVTRGYVKAEHLDAFKKKLESKMPGATLFPCEAPKGEEPPVSMRWNKWISPASLLVKMYGTPMYSSIDPTPYVASIFFLFVGMCLGDLVYGIGLILLMSWLKNKYREQRHLQDFFQCFVYCGFTAAIFGVLTGSWMGDLTGLLAKAFPAVKPLDDIRVSLTLLDPIKDSQTALYIAIGIGVLTQFYGMILRVHRDWRRGDKMGAFSDGILWICFLLFIILAAVTGSAFFWGLFLLSVIGLVLTQARDQSGWIGRILIGIISLYGIVGAYGASAILGDLISYARLMALGLTSAALGSTFNMLADLSSSIPAVGVIVAVLVVVFGHLMNFALGLLGGFVHSARLIMLEFFGRFYESGGSPYRPYGFHSTLVDEKPGRE